MAIYCIIANKEAAKLGARVKELYSDCYEHPPNAWFVVEKIGLNATTLGAQGVQGVVIMANGTSGYAPGDF